ncbi:MAG: hypothetical protein A3F72_14990 [Bacteroidetes bacterium RIFCSPLOWO2_12_FULL_35_15]|nr:MAG: hypothetical protein A3F72_14990 [Bacteroidetes bacterium RIFCSPLOWO2_12_FULL_35_15]
MHSYLLKNYSNQILLHFFSKKIAITISSIFCFIGLSIAQPANDDPCNAIVLTPTASCIYTTYTNAAATLSSGVPAPGCASYSGADVWFQVTVPATGLLVFDTQTGVLTDGGMAIYSGTCGALTLISCDDDSSPNGLMPMISTTTLTPGDTIWISVWEYGNNNNGTFGICVTAPLPPPPLTNDDPCNAITITPTASCAYTTYTNAGATPSAGVPAPGCASYSGGDVWFNVIVPAGGILNFDTQTGIITDGGMAIYSGTCGALALISCNDDGSPNGLMPMITATGLSQGDTIWVRFWEYGNNNNGTFGICVTAPPPPPIELPCTNLGFESGFTGWYGTVGNSVSGLAGASTPVYQPTVYNTTAGTNFTLVTAGTDPIAGFPLVFSGTNSIRLGNSATYETHNAASIQQTFQVTATNTNFTYNYAVVFQDGAHPDYEQPFFKADVYDQNGVPVSCGLYEDAAPGTGYTQTTPTSDIWYKPWTTVSVNLNSYIGQTVTVKFTTSDCSLGAHYGYAYIDCSCFAYGIISPAVICQGASAILSAPAGSAAYLWSPGGDTTSTITVSPASTTTYTCDITTQGTVPCYFTLTTTVTVNSAPTVTVDAVTICLGDSTTLTATPSLAGGTYLWAPGGATTQSILISPLSTETYTVSYTNGCVVTDTALVTINDCSCTVTATNNGPVCPNGTFGLTASNVVDVVGYSWVGPSGYTSNTQNPTGILASATSGTYTYTITATTALSTCIATTTITVNPDALITLTSAVGTNAQAICAGSAITPISYLLTGGATGASISGLPVGISGSFSGGVFTISGTPTISFNYTITTTGTCAQTTATGSVIVNHNAVIALTSAVGTNAQTLCSNTVITPITYSVTVGGTGAGVTGLPSGVTGSFSGGVFTITGTPTVAGTFNYTVTTTGVCTQVTATGSITVNPGAVITLTSAVGTDAQTVCINTALNSITYSITNGGTGAGVTGLPTGVTGSFSAGLFTISGTPSGTGIFNYTVTTTGACTPATATGSIIIDPDAIIALTSVVGTDSQTLCVNTAITPITYSVTAGGTGAIITGLPTGVTGSFSGGVFTINGAPTATGTFNYSITTTGVCTQAAATGSITVNPGAVITLTSAAGTNAQTICINTALNQITYSITNGGTGAGITGLPAGVTGSFSAGVFTISGTPTVTGAFSYSVITTGACTPATATGNILVTPDASIALSSVVGTDAQSLCANTALTTITYNVTGGGTGAGVSGLPTGVTGSYSGGIFTISGTPASTGTFNYSITTSGTCIQPTVTGSIIVTPNAAIVLTSAVGTNTQTLCVNTAMTLITYSVSGGGTGAGITGLPNGITGSYSAGVYTISGTPTTTGTFNYTVTTTGTCAQTTAIGSIIVSTNAAIAITSAVGTNAQTLCINTAITPITYSVTGGGTGAGVTGLPSGVTGSYAGGVFTISGTPTTSGTYNYTVTTTGGCSQATANGNIIVNPLPPTPVAGNNGPICEGAQLNLTSNIISGATYSWMGPNGFTSSIEDPTVSVNSTIAMSGTYSVTVTVAGCTSLQGTTSVFVNSNPTASFTTSPNPATGASPLVVSFTNTSQNATSYSWAFGDGSTSSSANPSNNTYTTGIYSVVLTVSDNVTSCTNSTSATVIVYDNYSIIIPNVFTPNGDITNDIYKITATGVSTFDAEIYDRWGLKMYEWHDVSGGWNGRAKSGAEAKDGTYYYIIKVTASDGTDHEYKGYLTLLK